MSSWNFTDLKRHRGHKIAFVHYGTPTEVANISIECEDCGEVILSQDRGSRGFDDLNKHYGHIGNSKKFKLITFSGKPPHTVMLHCPECNFVLLKYQRVKVIVEGGVAECTVVPPDVEFQLVDRDMAEVGD